MGVNGLSYQQLLEKNRAILTDIKEGKEGIKTNFQSAVMTIKKVPV